MTRPGISKVAGGRALVPSHGAVARYAPRADAVLVGHTHFDHAMDVPAIALCTGARVYGSRSLANLMAASGAGDRATVVDLGRAYEIRPFVVTFVESVHSKLVLGLAVPFDGELT